MNAATESLTVAASVSTGQRSMTAPSRAALRDWALYIFLTALVVGAWQFSRLGYFESNSRISYWIGVVGGSMMLLLFLYPTRKRVKFMRGWGPLKYWFTAHMMLGIAGPLLILIHSTFKVGSLNATMALISMLIVAGSGIVGRFLYRHVHRGLQGEKTNLRELQSVAGFQHEVVKSRFHFVPTVEQRLLAFEAEVLKSGSRWHTPFARMFVLPYRQWQIYRVCGAELDQTFSKLRRERGWSRDDYLGRRQRARALMRSYLQSVVRVAQFATYERLFSLWHVLHVPFLYLLVASAVAHVVAVHIY